MQSEKFTDIVSKQLLKRSLTRSEIAGRFGMTESTVSERLKALKIAVSKVHPVNEYPGFCFLCGLSLLCDPPQNLPQRRRERREKNSINKNKKLDKRSFYRFWFTVEFKH
jgi:AraC-like DNA-binding protein